MAGSWMAADTTLSVLTNFECTGLRRMREWNGHRTAFIALWTGVVLAKLLVAARLPLFVDEAFYWQEGQHLAWAYSALRVLPAWTMRLGVELCGDSVLAARALFVVISAAVP